MTKHNHLAVWAMVIANQVIGFIWYGLIFGRMWAEGQGKTVEQMQQQGEGNYMPYIASIIGNVFLCYVLSWAVQKMDKKTFAEGAMLGLILFIGIGLPAIMVHYQFLNIGKRVTLIDVGMSAVVTILSAGVLAVWRKKS